MKKCLSLMALLLLLGSCASGHRKIASCQEENIKQGQEYPYYGEKNFCQ